MISCKPYSANVTSHYCRKQYDLSLWVQAVQDCIELCLIMSYNNYWKWVTTLEYLLLSERNQRLTTNKSCIVNAWKTTWENNNKISWIILFSKFLNGYMWKLLELHDTMTQQLKSATQFCLKWENSNKPTQWRLLVATSVLNTHSMAHSIVKMIPEWISNSMTCKKLCVSC